jgi:hypothetical protein
MVITTGGDTGIRTAPDSTIRGVIGMLSADDSASGRCPKGQFPPDARGPAQCRPTAIRRRGPLRDEVKQIQCFHVMVADRPGEGARVLTAFRHAGVRLLGFSGFSLGHHQARLVLVPQDPAALVNAAKAAQIPLSGKETAFLNQGDDRAGVLAKTMTKLALSEINITSAQLFCGDDGRYGGIVWLKPADVQKAAKALAVRDVAARDDAIVDLASDGSFPASDSPPWTP